MASTNRLSASVPPMLRRVVTALMLVLAFMVMASVFKPDLTRAGGPRERSASSPAASHQSRSIDPHEGLRSLGIIEDLRLRVHIYATELGPRYTIREIASGKEVGTLLSEEQVQRYFPEVQLPTLQTDAASPLMMVDPVINDWHR